MPRESDNAEEKANAKGKRGAERTMRARKRKADVATFLQDPDEKLAKTEMTRPKLYENQPAWNTVYQYACVVIPAPDNPVVVNYSHFMQIRAPTRPSPLPVLDWASRDEVWTNMIKKDNMYVRDKFYMQKHPLLQPRMRTILLDWLMEVCEAYKLQRETFYLAQDIFDRFMATQQDVAKRMVQLIGVSSLFIAAKIEEVYPPRLHQFAYVTDGACTENEIISMEIIIMKALNWNLNPVTPVSWLNTYLQIAYLNEQREILLTQYPQQIFVQIAELLDLCALDIGSLEYTYGLLAASAFYHFSSFELMQKVSGYEWYEVERCVTWMVPFAMAIREVGSSQLKHFRGIAPEVFHSIQTHIRSLDLLDKAQAIQAMLAEQSRTASFSSGILTPPQSSRKESSGQQPM